jgi:hypothetical protein
MVKKELGKIQAAEFGFGGRDDVMFGATFKLGGEAWAVQDFWGCWSPSQIKVTAHTRWTEPERDKWLAENARRIDKLLHDAKARRFSDLVGKPIEATFDCDLLKEWRILTEVL